MLKDSIKKARLLELNRNSHAKNYHIYYQRKKIILLNDPEKRKKDAERKKRWKEKQMEKPEFRMQVKLCSRLRTTIKSGKEWYNYLGCDMVFLQKWFEYHFRLLKEFNNIDLSWDNHDWEIDHVVPCSAFDFNNKHHRKICFHWSNLAPMTKSDNSSKRAKILPQIIKRQIVMANIYNLSTGNNKTVLIINVYDKTGALTTAANGKLLVQQKE